MSGVCFLDTETTGLDADVHDIWEVGLIVDDAEYLWQLAADLGAADARALDIGHFHQRRWDEATQEWADQFGKTEMAASLSGTDWRSAQLTDVVSGFAVPAHCMATWAQRFSRLTWGRHIVGAVPNFDTQRLESLMRRYGACPGWHYHLIDVEALAVGFLAGRRHQGDLDGVGVLAEVPGLPWNSDDLSMAVGVKAPGGDVRHTALGDARWAKALYEKVTGGEAVEA